MGLSAIGSSQIFPFNFFFSLSCFDLSVKTPETDMLGIDLNDAPKSDDRFVLFFCVKYGRLLIQQINLIKSFSY